MILFAWDGFPQYAARCVGAYVRASREKVVVIATRPDVPIDGMERCCNCPVVWVGPDDRRKLSELLEEMPRVLIVSGWAIRVFNGYADDVRRTGGRVVAMCDNNFVPTFKEVLRAVRFRLFLRRRYDAFFVPGNSGVRLLRFYGVPGDRIFTGLYAADDALFHDGPALAARSRKIIYVGRFNDRKNVLRLLRAFQSVSRRFPDWRLDLYGSGPLKEALARAIGDPPPAAGRQPPIVLHDFVQPEQLAALYRSARVFCLPSLWEHWGLVVHEAALSGCVLLLGNRTGAADDLLGKANGAVFDPYSVEAMARSLEKAMKMDDDALSAAQAESLVRAKTVSVDRFVSAVKSLTAVGKTANDPSLP